MTKERNIRRTVLPSGLVVLTERMEHVRSVAMGVWMRAGSRHEVPELNGISHFVEHMVFKGTKSRSAQRIAREVDAIGGNLDAFTGKETVCFNMKVLDEHVPTALDVLSDLVLNPVFATKKSPASAASFSKRSRWTRTIPTPWSTRSSPRASGRAIPWASRSSAPAIPSAASTRTRCWVSFEQRFQAGNMVFSAAGNLEHDAFVELVAKHFSSLAPGSVCSDGAAPTVTSRIHLRNKKSLEQVQMCLGVPAPPVADSSRYTTLLLNTILGGGMSSRLFQTVREERGLVYAIYSDLNPYRDTGSLCVYAGTSADRALQVIDLIMEEFRRLKSEPLQPGELRRAKDQLKGNLLLSLESSMSRMSNLARQQMYFERFFSLDEILDRVENVTEEQVMTMATQLFQPDKVALTLLGRLDGLRVTRQSARLLTPRSQSFSSTAAKNPSHGCTPGIVRRYGPSVALRSRSRPSAVSTPPPPARPESPPTGTRRNPGASLQRRLHHLLVLLRLQRARGVDQPPTRPHARQPGPQNRRCRACCRPRSASLTRSRISGFRAIVPVPLHGTSHRIRSHSGCSCHLRRIGHFKRASAPPAPRGSILRIASSRFRLTSTAVISASGSRSARIAVFPPGAAHRSSTRTGFVVRPCGQHLRNQLRPLVLNPNPCPPERPRSWSHLAAHHTPRTRQKRPRLGIQTSQALVRCCPHGNGAGS